ncbi:MAG: 2Fe-2S iron-sulfur cluster-binding protein [Chitinophagaceae bacterium]|nr:2Fe-2S iron-sulfur cluster-binding protein [Chitinophagaceae bacterium]
MSDQLFKVTIDNITVEVPAGTTILMAARQIGGDVTPPAMCFYSKLQGSGGKCRTCLVEVSKGSEKDPRPMPKLVASCRTTVMDGMEVKNITSERVLDARAGVTEFLLLNHPSIARFVTRLVSVICRTSAMNMAKKVPAMNFPAALSRKKILDHIYSYI